MWLDTFFNCVHPDVFYDDYNKLSKWKHLLFYCEHLMKLLDCGDDPAVGGAMTGRSPSNLTL